MTIKEKLCKLFDGLKIETSNKLVKIADDYAIEFAEWLEINVYKEGNLWKMYSVKYTLFNTKELLEIFKKEKGL
jgi:hypothetical protein